MTDVEAAIERRANNLGDILLNYKTVIKLNSVFNKVDLLTILYYHSFFIIYFRYFTGDAFGLENKE